MIRVSFTKFLDFVAQNGEPKATTALSAWRQSNTPYDPARDYHRRIRDEIKNRERKGTTLDWEPFIAEQTQKKQKNYAETATRYDKWRKKFSSVSWFDPPRDDWKQSEFRVTVNPELGLVLDGQKHAVKLFLNKNKLSRLKAQTAGLLMHETLASHDDTLLFSIFDIKAGAFHTFSGATEKLEYLLIGESAHLSAMLNAIKGS